MSLSVAHNQGHTLKSEIVGLFPAVFGDVPQCIEVRQDSLDRLTRQRWDLTRRIPDRAALWKVDVEGAELDLLPGARDLLRRCPPRAILCESYPTRRRCKKSWGPPGTACRPSSGGSPTARARHAGSDAGRHAAASSGAHLLFLHREALDPALGARLDGQRWDQRG
ncbi:MAG: FkbM family methyltransferase [Roseococcus sp.]|nr:FkbM family methyltransferase [Roseococcus sp.]